MEGRKTKIILCRSVLIRFDLLAEMNLLCDTDHAALRSFSWGMLMGQDRSLTKQVSEKVVRLVLDFLKKTKRFERKSGGS